MSRQQVPGWAVQCCAEQEFAAHGVCSSQAVGGSCPKQTNQLIPGKQQGELFQPFSWSTQDQNNSNKLFFHTLEQWKSWDFACDSTLHPSPATARTELSRDAETGWGTSQEGLCLGHHSEQSLLWHCSPWGSGQAAAQSASPARTGLLWVTQAQWTMAQPGELREVQGVKNKDLLEPELKVRILKTPLQLLPYLQVQFKDWWLNSFLTQVSKSRVWLPLLTLTIFFTRGVH